MVGEEGVAVAYGYTGEVSVGGNFVSSLVVKSSFPVEASRTERIAWVLVLPPAKGDDYAVGYGGGRGVDHVFGDPDGVEDELGVGLVEAEGDDAAVGGRAVGGGGFFLADDAGGDGGEDVAGAIFVGPGGEAVPGVLGGGGGEAGGFGEGGVVVRLRLGRPRRGGRRSRPGRERRRIACP